MYLRSKSNRGYYYYCTLHENYNATICPKKAVKQEDVESLALRLIQTQIRAFSDAQRLIANLNATPSSQTRYQIYETQIDDAKRKIEKFNQLKAALYGDFADGLLSHQDYTCLLYTSPDEDVGHPGSVVASFTAQPTTDPPVFSQTATAPKSTQPTQQQVQPPVQQSHAPAPEPPKTLDEYLRVMTIEQAKAVKVDFGRFSGWSLGEIAMKSPGDLAWYVKNYSGHNLALKAGATKLLETVGQMAS